MTYIPEEPPDENETFENLDESMDEGDLPGHGGGPEGGRDVDDLIADQTALHEAGADLDDPDRISLLDGGMDDPDGSGPPRIHEPGDDAVGPEDRERPSEESTGDEAYGDPDLQFVETDPADMEQIAEDAPGPDSARW